MNLPSPATTMTNTVCPDCEQRQMTHVQMDLGTLWHCHACGEKFLVCEDMMTTIDDLSDLDSLKDQAAEAETLKDTLDKVEADIDELIDNIKKDNATTDNIIETLEAIYRSI